MKMIKNICIVVYSLIVIVMAVITIIGKFLGIDYVATHCYGAWWFTLLWASLVIVGIFYFMFQRVHRWWVVMLHTSFVLILFGALLTHLGLGIFIGAIWANVSWGTYWSWDPKETWALITFMTYGVVVHTQLLPVFQRPMVYHLYMLFSFLTLLMTYFGVNYVLGGMHSYA